MYNEDIRQSLKILREIDCLESNYSSTMRRKKSYTLVCEEFDSEEKMPEEGNSFKSDGTTYVFDGEKWKTSEGGVLKPEYQETATQKWREELGTEEKITVTSTPLEAVRVLQDKYGLKNREIISIFKEAGIDYKSDDPIGEEKIDNLVQVLKVANIRPQADDEATGETLTADMEKHGKEISDATPEDFMNFVMREKGASVDKAEEMLNVGGVSKDDPTIAGNEEELARVVDQEEKQGEIAQVEPEKASAASSENIITEFEGAAKAGALRKARLAAREVKKTKGADLENNLAKLGAAFLIANKLI